MMLLLFVALFLQNVFRQLTVDMLQVSQSATVSYIVEELVALTDRSQLTQLMRQFSVDWETVCCHQFASHVTEALVKRSALFLCTFQLLSFVSVKAHHSAPYSSVFIC